MPFTSTAIRNAMPGKTSRRLFDALGLYLEVAPSGGRWWRFKYHIAGKEKRISPGVLPHVSLADAREARDAARKLLADGTDPSAQRKADRKEALGQSINSCDTVPRFDANMRMALRAQSQCRATLETLAAIKNPPVVIAKQANVTTGPQQVNNGVPATPLRARETETEPNRLLEAEHGQRMDTRATSATIGSDQTLAAVGTVNGTKDRRG